MSLKISNISKRQDDFWILRDVSFDVAGGEIFGLLGESDEEKSAVLRLINGTEETTSGEIAFAGSNSADARLGKQSLIFPPTEVEPFWKKVFPSKTKPALSENENIQRDFENNLKNAEDVLLLDNPFSRLNENSRDKIYENLRAAVKEKNLAVIYATNNHEEAFTVCDRVGVLKNGEIVQTGTPRELYEKPNCVAVADALGRCNFIEAMRVSFNNQNSQEFQTLKGEQHLQIDKTDKRLLGAINTPVTLAVRPEHISISFGASFPEDNLIRAKISAVQYRGATTRVSLDANGLILEALVLRLVGLNIGDECMVGLPPDRIQVLKN